MKLFLVFCFTCFQLVCTAQLPREELSSQDTIQAHSPRKAFLFSACLPGAGQVYNHLAMPQGSKRAFWKVPLIYAAMGTTGYFLIKNNKSCLSLKAEYQNRMNGGELNNLWSEYDDQGILTMYDQHASRRDLFILGFCVVYFMQILDAGIEAHFTHFDVSEDLSMVIQPAYLGSNSYGLSLNINFR